MLFLLGVFAVLVFGLIGFLVGAVLFRYLPERTVSLGMVLAIGVAIWFSLSPVVFMAGGALVYERASRPPKVSKDRLPSGD
jgi:hypothetical protein